MIHILARGLQIFDIFVLSYFVTLEAIYTTLSVIALGVSRVAARRLRYGRFRELLGATTTPPLTIILPAHNEEAVIAQSVRSMSLLEYPHLELVVVNDGSTDGTLSRLVSSFSLVPSAEPLNMRIPCAPIHAVYRSQVPIPLTVVDKENGGKHDALNAGLNACWTPLCCLVDGDVVLEPDAVLRMVRVLQEDLDTVAVGGNIRPSNNCFVDEGRVVKRRLSHRPIVIFQTIEYLRSFVAARVGWAAANSLQIVSGAFGVFRRESLIAVGGFADGSIGEDFEMTLRLHRWARDHKRHNRIAFAPDAVAWTEVPDTLAVLRRQRVRWHHGLFQTLCWHKSMLLRPRYGMLGMVGLPYQWVFEWGAPIVETFGLAMVLLGLPLGLVNIPFALLFLALALLLGGICSFSSLALEARWHGTYRNFADWLLLMIAGCTEYVGYRQLTALWRLRATFGRYKGWGKMDRTGFRQAGGSYGLPRAARGPGGDGRPPAGSGPGGDGEAPRATSGPETGSPTRPAAASGAPA
jgi:cellulose synthase/poly-beta-1,6-N-acetylglucosamine synthase-like glycosyltransferase